jgi:DNA polymerase (family X)
MRAVADETLDNAALAEELERFASLLAAAGSNAYAVRAYRRVADRVRAFPVPVAELVRQGRAREIAGVGPGIEPRLRELVETGTLAEAAELRERLAPELVKRARRRGSARRGLLLNRARALADRLANELDGVAAGDPRRGAELTAHIAVVVSNRTALDRLAELPDVIAVAERDGPRVLAVTTEGVAVEVVAAQPSRFGTELVRATGSPEWVAALEPLPDAPTEEDVFAALGLPWVPPELREVGAAPPPPGDLVELTDIRGDLHAHTTWSDGKASVLELAEAAQARGYEYVAVCDHTRAVSVVPGLDADDVRRQGEEIAAANERLAPFRVLRGIECDILPDGSLDLPDDVLAELDWVQISLHAGQRRPREELTARVLSAMRHPSARCLSHPKGRLLNHRPENALDLDEVFAVALETGVALEVNGLPDRLDLSGVHVAEAMAAGVPIVCSTDAHSTRGLANMELSIATARRGGASRGAVLNTRPLAELLRHG